MRLLLAEPDRLGECPRWDAGRRRLDWIDIDGRRLSSCDAQGGDVERLAFADKPASFARRRCGGLLIAFRRRLALVDAAGRELASIVPDAVDFTRERFNDGACDPAGRFWVGTMAMGMKEPAGALYRVDSDLTVRRMDAGFAVSNGIAWSPSGDLLYHCDTQANTIRVHDFDTATGAIAHRRVFATLEHPDGCTTDMDGGLWVAQPGLSRVVRLDATGRISATLAVPVRHPSSVTFGSLAGDQLFITTIGATTLPDASPAAGCLFTDHTEHRGVAQALFAG